MARPCGRRPVAPRDTGPGGARRCPHRRGARRRPRRARRRRTGALAAALPGARVLTWPPAGPGVDLLLAARCRPARCCTPAGCRGPPATSPRWRPCSRPCPGRPHRRPHRPPPARRRSARRRRLRPPAVAPGAGRARAGGDLIVGWTTCGRACPSTSARAGSRGGVGRRRGRGRRGRAARAGPAGRPPPHTGGGPGPPRRGCRPARRGSGELARTLRAAGVSGRSAAAVLAGLGLPRREAYRLAARAPLILWISRRPPGGRLDSIDPVNRRARRIPCRSRARRGQQPFPPLCGSAAGTTAAAAVGPPGCRPTAPGAIVVRELGSGALRDLDWTPEADAEVEAGRAGLRGRPNVLRHSTAHVLAQAVQDLFPEAKLGIGPPIDNGFYYDFQVEQAVHPGGPGQASRSGCRRSSRRGSGSGGGGSPIDEAARRAGRRAVQARAGRPQGRCRRHRGRSMEVGGGELTIYDNLDREVRRAVLDRPVPRPAPAHHPADPGVQADPVGRGVLAGKREEPAAPAHLRHRVADPRRAQGVPAAAGGGGPARPPQARRRPGPVLASPTRSAPGLAVFHPKGGIIRRELEDYSRRRHEQAGYEFVNSPHITKGDLFQTSGHLPYYADTMFPPMQMEGAETTTSSR